MRKTWKIHAKTPPTPTATAAVFRVTVGSATFAGDHTGQEVGKGDQEAGGIADTATA